MRYQGNNITVVGRGASDGTLREWLARGPFTLAMSSGFFSFFAHGGVLSALEEARLLPAALAGSSAGALTGGLWAAGLSADRIAELYFSLRKHDFWDPGPGLGLLRGRRFRALIRRVSPVERLEHCRRAVAVSVFDLLRWRTRVLSRGDLTNALYASCAVPFMFHPIRSHGGLLVDGGVADRPGMAGVPPGQRVLYHHIAARSRWRRGSGPALDLPVRENMVALVVGNLPRPGPEALELGPAAWQAACDAVRSVLDQPIGGGHVEPVGLAAAPERVWVHGGR
jgi:NTE family protein